MTEYHRPGRLELASQTVNNWLLNTFALHEKYDSPLERQRAAALLVMSLLFATLGFFGTLILAITLPELLPAPLILPNIILSIIFAMLYLLVQRGRLQLASVIFVTAALIVLVAQGMLHGDLQPELLIVGYAIPIISSALLFKPSRAFITAILSIAGIGLTFWLQYLIRPQPEEYLSALIGFAVTSFLMLVLALYTWLLVSNLYRWAEEAQRRARQLEAAAVVSETAAVATNLRMLLNVVVERIRDAFGFYHAQVFLIDQENIGQKHRGQVMARLEASTGRAGEALLARGHALQVGSRSVIGQCTHTGRPVVINDVTNDPVHRPNELLPNTHGELALPLVAGGGVIGALDVQSTIPNAFKQEDIRSLQIMANQLAVTIEKTRLVEELQVSAEENRRLLEEAQSSLRQIEELNQRLTREGWRDYLRERRSGETVGYTLHEKGVMEHNTDWTAPMRQAYQGEKTVVIRQDQQAHIAAVPLRVRGEIVGVLEIERGGDRPWTDTELELAEALVERLALAVENARLYEQATYSAEREHMVNRIAQEVQQAETIDDVLQTALAELGRVLGASRGVVQISPKAAPYPEISPGDVPLDSGA